MTDIRERKGLIASVCLSGAVTPQFSTAFSNLRSYNDRNGLHAVEYKIFHAVLVEAGRDGVVQHALANNYEWLMQIDADAAPFPPNACERFLRILFDEMPQLAVIGGYCMLKNHPNLPTVDTGTGTWEEHYPGEGILPVIRTGAHFFMAKTEAFKRLGPAPWFRTRIPAPPVQAMMDLDNFARCNLGGKNPLTEHPEWLTLFAQARKAGMGKTTVGEDSAFFDTLRAHGMMAAVDTDTIVGHVADRILMPKDFVDNVRAARSDERAALGVRTWP